MDLALVSHEFGVYTIVVVYLGEVDFGKHEKGLVVIVWEGGLRQAGSR